MRTVRGAAPVPTPPVDPQCIACRRNPSQIPIGGLEYAQVPGIGGHEWLCSDPADCRRHWPVSEVTT